MRLGDHHYAHVLDGVFVSAGFGIPKVSRFSKVACPGGQTQGELLLYTTSTNGGFDRVFQGGERCLSHLAARFEIFGAWRGQPVAHAVKPIYSAWMKDEYGYLPSLSTPRARLSKQRKRQGLRCITVLLHRAQIGYLVRKGFLDDDQRGDREAVRRAFDGFLYDALMPKTAFFMELYSKSLLHKT
jgi:hypothetical protein